MSINETIVMCEDDSAISLATKKELSIHNIHVIRTINGTSAINKIEKGNIKIAIVDLKLPGKYDGIETAKIIQERYQNVIIIFLTAFDNEKYRNKAANEELVIYKWITKKPDFLDELLASINEVLFLNYYRFLHFKLTKLGSDFSLDESQLNILKKEMIPLSMRHTSFIKQDDVHTNYNNEEFQTDIYELNDFVLKLTINIEELKIGFENPAIRIPSWGRFKETIEKYLWVIVENKPDKYLQQLAIVLERATNKIDAHFLTIEILKPIELILERIRSNDVSQYDVTKCKEAFRKFEIEVAPVFSEVLNDFNHFYNTEENNNGHIS